MHERQIDIALVNVPLAMAIVEAGVDDVVKTCYVSDFFVNTCHVSDCFVNRISCDVASSQRPSST